MRLSTPLLFLVAFALGVMLSLAGPVRAWAQGASVSEDDAGATVVSGADAKAAHRGTLPGVRIDREAGVIDIDAEVVYREGDWLELVACTPGTREYESLLRVRARPSHVHLALLTLGLEPGRPMSWREKPQGGYNVVPPRGPRVAVEVVLPGDGDAPDVADVSDAAVVGAAGRQGRVVPIHAWIVNQQTGEGLADNIWLFTGSEFVPANALGPPDAVSGDTEGENGESVAADIDANTAAADTRPIYLADANGTVVSLVNFGDDLLARPTSRTNRDDDAQWNARPDALPPLGTAVKLRLRPIVEDERPSTP